MKKLSYILIFSTEDGRRHYNDLLKIKICTMKNISKVNNDRDKLTNNIKPKLQIAATCLTFVFFYWYFYLKAVRTSKCYKIVKQRYNLLSMRLQFHFTNLQIFMALSDQILNAYLVSYYKQLGADMTFWIWTSFWMTNIIGKGLLIDIKQ